VDPQPKQEEPQPKQDQSPRVQENGDIPVPDRPPYDDKGEDDKVGQLRHPRRVLVALVLAGLALLGLVVILIVINSGPTVPDVVGMTESKAERKVGNNYTINVESVRVEDQPSGTIIGQDPEAGEAAEQGSAISVVVSAGQPPNPGDILRDDFSNNSSGWDESEGGSYERWARDYSGLQYRLYMKPPAGGSANKPLPSLRPGKVVGNGIVEVDAVLQSNDPGTDAYWGVICRAQDTSNYYVFRIGVDRRAYIWRKVNDSYRILDVEPASEAITSGMETNHLRADCIGSKLTFYVNDQKVVEVEDETFRSGLVGVEVENDVGEPIEVRFDNYSVSSP
jgi:hypothetical protein